MRCQKCGQTTTSTRPAILEGKYYSAVGLECINEQVTGVIGSNAGYERRRQYEDYADETVQPYNAAGPNPEFYRLYPDKAPKVFTPAEIEQVKRKL